MLPKLALDHVTGCATHNCPQRTKFFGLDWMSKTTLRIYIHFEFRASGGNQEKNHMHSELEISCQYIHPAHTGYETQMQENGQQQKLCSSLLVIFSKWQNLHCVQNVAGDTDRDLTAVEYLAADFSRIYLVGTMIGEEAFILFICKASFKIN